MASNTYRYRKGTVDKQYFPKDTTTSAVLIGDMVKISSGEIVVVSTSTDNVNFRGVAMTASPANSSDEVLVYLPNADAQFDYPLNTSSTFTHDARFAISSGNSDAQTLAYAANGTDTVAIAADNGSSATTARVRFKIPDYYKGDAS